MRRTTAIVVAGVVVLGGAAAGTTVAIGASEGSPSATSQASHIADSLATPAGRARYDLGAGRLISADVCVRGACVHRQFAPAVTCASTATTCIGSALVVRKFAHGVTISAELV